MAAKPESERHADLVSAPQGTSAGVRRYDIAVVGEWHLAFVTAACFAAAGHRTALVKPSGSWPPGQPACPVSEPGLPELIAEATQRGLLSFESDFDGEWTAQTVWMAIDTPVNERDEPNVEPLLHVAEAIRQLPDTEVFATSSQVPIGFCRRLEGILGPRIAYIPENLRLGQGIETFARADRTVIGASDSLIGESVRQLMKSFDTTFLMCDLPTAEMVKHANNAFLAMSISFANEMAHIGSQFGVDSYLVAKALKLDARIGSKAYVAPGLGFAGGTLPRDLRVLEEAGREYSIPTSLTSAVLEVNRATSELVASVVARELTQGSVAADSKPRVLILGYTYKADTDTLRRSLSIEIAATLRGLGFECHGFDPVMNDKDLSELSGLITHHPNLASVPTCGVALLMTSRAIFRKTDWSELDSDPGAPTLLVDTQGFLDEQTIRQAGLGYRRLWAPAATGESL